MQMTHNYFECVILGIEGWFRRLNPPDSLGTNGIHYGGPDSTVYNYFVIVLESDNRDTCTNTPINLSCKSNVNSIKVN